MDLTLGKHIIAQRNAWSPSISIGIFDIGFDGRASVATSITMEKLAEGSELAPLISIKPWEAQELMDSLWQCGLRPTEGTGSAGAMAATERHLKDIQAILGKQLDIILGGKN